jgi:hypothetical protein
MFLRACAVLLSSLFTCTPLQAAEWFVSPNGNDATGTGSQGNPFRTVRRVLSTSNGVVQAGDTVTLRGPASNNTYSECDVRLRVRLTLRSFAGERARIHCDINTPNSVTIQIDPGASGSRLSNLEVTGGRYYAVFLQTNWYVGGGENLTGASDVVIEDLLIHSTGRDGIKVTPKSNRLTVRRTEIHSTGMIYPPGTPLDNRNADGIDNVQGSGMRVQDSFIHNISTTGLYFKGGAQDVVIERNVIDGTGMGGILVGFDTSVDYFDRQANPGWYESIRGTVRNNLVMNTQYAGIGLYASQDALVVNNTLINTALRGHAAIYYGVVFQDWDPIAGRPPNLRPRVLNNLVIQNSGKCVDIRHSNELGGLSGLAGASGTNFNAFTAANGSCRFTDQRPGSPIGASGTLAQWRSHSGGDANSLQGAYSVDATGHLPANSPLIDAGTPVSGVVDDIDGEARGSQPDIGADERAAPGGSVALFASGFE